MGGKETCLGIGMSVIFVHDVESQNNASKGGLGEGVKSAPVYAANPRTLLRDGSLNDLKQAHNTCLHYTIETKPASNTKFKKIKYLIPQDCLVGPSDCVPGLV